MSIIVLSKNYTLCKAMLICDMQDLVERIRRNVPLAENDRGGKVNYGPYDDVDENYNDWPFAT